ncbi:MAG: hypothetical protein QMC83_07850 [Thermodesulfovibrionales bacterium]|nr:hypothetical protein [Thermodesulfovibrionales bacterium]
MTENPVTLGPGETKNVTISFLEIPKGNYTGILAIRDEFTYQEYITSLNSPYIPLTPVIAAFKSVFKWEWIFVFALVFSGAMASIILTKAMPVASEKKKNRGKIIELNGLIKTLTVFELKLNVKFMVDLIKARTINDNTKIFTPSADERIKNINSILDKLDKQLGVRKKSAICISTLTARIFCHFPLKKRYGINWRKQT